MNIIPEKFFFAASDTGSRISVCLSESIRNILFSLAGQCGHRRKHPHPIMNISKVYEKVTVFISQMHISQAHCPSAAVSYLFYLSRLPLLCTHAFCFDCSKQQQFRQRVLQLPSKYGPHELRDGQSGG